MNARTMTDENIALAIGGFLFAWLTCKPGDLVEVGYVERRPCDLPIRARAGAATLALDKAAARHLAERLESGIGLFPQSAKLPGVLEVILGLRAAADNIEALERHAAAR